ncbi:helix-turn-helix domain-containing protein [Gemmatimonas sp.]|uniref:helix-turn-helix domain-containing protein n=1 Tax=Gemmatimonas sp. TaxID=1962908 RepID=UPI0037BF3CB0
MITATARLAFIREWLSLNISQLATALDVTRPTVYDWLSGERVPHADNALRIKQVYDLAREWEQMSSVPLRVSATTPIVDDKTLLSALSGPSPDVSLARAMLDRCSEEGAPTVRNEHDRALTKATIEDAERVARWLR